MHRYMQGAYKQNDTVEMNRKLLLVFPKLLSVAEQLKLYHDCIYISHLIFEFALP